MILLFVFLSALVAIIEPGDVNVKEYLTRFGYHNRHLLGSKTSNQLSKSLKLFQKTYGLKVTGKADAETIALMKTPRCGNKDYGASMYRDTPWRKKALSYYYHNYTPDMSQSQVRALTERALKYWADETPLKFTERTNGDIVIAFGSSQHGDNRKTCYYDFDGQGGVLAHAFFPPDGRLHFDESERYTDRTSSGTNYLWVATHELGHILGLEHDTQTKDAVMYPYYRGYKAGFKLHESDIRRIQALYGPGSGGGTQPPPTQPPTQPPPTTKAPPTGCFDDYSRCDEYKSYCQSDKDWSYKYCRKTCNMCTGTGGGNCNDAFQDCYKFDYVCTDHKEWAYKNCRKTCNMCSGKCVDTVVNCDEFKGYCQLSSSGWKDYMEKNCYKTCYC